MTEFKESIVQLRATGRSRSGIKQRRSRESRVDETLSVHCLYLTSQTSASIVEEEAKLMIDTYSTYDAKARFSEILRKVRGGETVYITYRGEVVAEMKPIEKADSMEARIKRLEERGVITRRPVERAPLKPIANRPGAVKRFLEERD